jgi:hypothetical protein
MDYRTSFELQDYPNIEYWNGKQGKLSEYRISDTKLKLLGYQIIKKSIDCPALETIINTSGLNFYVNMKKLVAPLSSKYLERGASCEPPQSCRG